jgi:hypothetical protein
VTEGWKEEKKKNNPGGLVGLINFFSAFCVGDDIDLFFCLYGYCFGPTTGTSPSGQENRQRARETVRASAWPDLTLTWGTDFAALSYPSKLCGAGERWPEKACLHEQKRGSTTTMTGENKGPLGDEMSHRKGRRWMEGWPVTGILCRRVERVIILGRLFLLPYVVS